PTLRVGGALVFFSSARCSYIESCFIVDDVSVVGGGGGVGAGAMVVSALYPPPPMLVSGLDFVAVSMGAGAGGGRLRAVSAGETRPVSGGGDCPALFSLCLLQAASAAAAANVRSNRIAKSLVGGFGSWWCAEFRPQPGRRLS